MSDSAGALSTEFPTLGNSPDQETLVTLDALAAEVAECKAMLAQMLGIVGAVGTGFAEFAPLLDQLSAGPVGKMLGLSSKKD